MLHGRAEELALIDRLLADAQSGRSGAHVLSGPAGIGKTALLDYAASKAQGLRVIRVAGIELEAELPFAGLHLLLHPALDRLDALPAPQAVALRSAFGLAPAQPSDRFLVGLAVLSMLAELAEDGPVLCLVDDAQWLDRSSTDALTFAARRLHHEGVLLLFAVRGDVRDPAGLSALVTRELTALEPAAAAALLDERYPELAPPVRARMLAETEGNPLALVELPSALSTEQRTGTASTGSYDLATLPLSARVQTAFGARAAGLDEAATALLLIAAAEETGRPEIVLAAAATCDAGPTELARVEDSGLLVRQGDRIAFRHPLARAAVLDAAPIHRRLDAHRALATALAAYGTVEADDRAAWHRAAAATGPDDDIAAALEAAADRASERADHTLAAAAMERAATMTVDPAATTHRLTRAAEAAATAGDLQKTAALLRRAARGPSDERDAPRLDHVRAIVESEFGSRHRAARMLIDSADRAPAELAGTMLVDAMRNGVLVGDTELGLLDLGAGRYDRVLDRVESAARGPMGEHYMAVFFTPLRVDAALRTGQPERIGESLERFRRWADASRAPWIQAVYTRCLAQMSSGEQAEAHFTAAVRLHEKGSRPLEAARTDLLYGEWLRRARRKTEARTSLRAALETFERIGAKVWAERTRAELRATGDTGRPAAGASVLDLLTPQELQVVRLAARGLSNREIGGHLFLSPRTVGYHLYKAYPKLGVAVRAELPALLDQL
ncbi:helix-turn-helix transcriptional regulator [Nocardia heshunensis]